jgi:hypothetical protein
MIRLPCWRHNSVAYKRKNALLRRVLISEFRNSADCRYPAAFALTRTVQPQKEIDMRARIIVLIAPHRSLSSQALLSRNRTDTC